MKKPKIQTSMRPVPVNYERDKVVTWLLELEGLNYHLGTLQAKSDYISQEEEDEQEQVRKKITDIRHLICAVLPGEERRPMVGDAAGLKV